MVLRNSSLDVAVDIFKGEGQGSVRSPLCCLYMLPEGGDRRGHPKAAMIRERTSPRPCPTWRASWVYSIPAQGPYAER